MKLFSLGFVSNHKRYVSLQIVFSILFFVIYAVLILFLRPFPSLYGDEYNSLFEANHPLVNLHSIGYSLQLHYWSKLFVSDLALRSLSLIWAVVGLLWMERWLATEDVPRRLRLFAVVVVGVNPFFWQYAGQIRFYSFFLAAALLVFWRCAEVRRLNSARNWLYFLLACGLVASAHLFGWLVVGMAFVVLFYHYRPRLLAGLVLVGSIGLAAVALWPPLTHQVIALVYRLTNPYAQVPPEGYRGISVTSFIKIGMTIYDFVFGERIHPLQWWITVPVFLAVLWMGIIGLQRLGQYPNLAVWMISGGALIVLLYLLFEPIAPPSLQGASPRYLIFSLPLLITVLALGTEGSSIRQGVLLGSQLLVLSIFFFPTWSNNGDLVDWANLLDRTIPDPATTCIVVDGRGRAPVERYAPAGVQIEATLDGCLSAKRILLVSNDYRLPVVRNFDTWAAQLNDTHTFVTNITRFPVQITAYDRGFPLSLQFPPGRLDLPEQDLHLPIAAAQSGQTLQGFVRLDAETPSFRQALPAGLNGPVQFVSDYLSAQPLAEGTPVILLAWEGANGHRQEEVLHAGKETAAWDGTCADCTLVATWTKRLHLVGAQAYPGAYRQFQATVWSAQLTAPTWPVQALTVTSLLDEGTIYYWGIFPVAAE